MNAETGRPGTDDPNKKSPASVNQSRLRTATEETSDLGNSPPRPLSTGQAAAVLGLSRATVHRLIVAGEITATAVPNASGHPHYRITPHALKSFRERHQTTRRIGGSR
jgi:excisionase family DNA binding protein